MKKIILILSITLIAFSCDKVDCPNELGCFQPDCSLEGDIVEMESGFNTFEKQVIFEFTGYKCNNCPEGAEEIKSLMNKMEDTLIPISIHSGFFSIPDSDGGKFTTDYRTKAGDEYEALFQPQGYPTAIVNFQQFDNKYQQSRSVWETLLRSEIDNSNANAPTINLKSSYSKESNALIASASIQFNENSNEKYNMIFLLLEDHIIDVQDVSGTVVDDYEHKHVLRSAFGKSLGEKVNAESIASGDIFDVTTVCTKLDKSWKIEDSEVIGVLYKTNEDKTFEAVQAQKVHVK